MLQMRGCGRVATFSTLEPREVRILLPDRFPGRAQLAPNLEYLISRLHLPLMQSSRMEGATGFIFWWALINSTTEGLWTRANTVAPLVVVIHAIVRCFEFQSLSSFE